MSTNQESGNEAKRSIHAEGAYIEGEVTVKGNFAGRDQYIVNPDTAQMLAKSFKEIFAAIEAHPSITDTDKADLHSDVEEIEEELTKGDKANESFLSKRLRNIGRIAPDILQVVIAAIADPLAGLGVVAAKIAEKAQNESGKKSTG